jgi:hypothetical protein
VTQPGRGRGDDRVEDAGEAALQVLATQGQVAAPAVDTGARQPSLPQDAQASRGNPQPLLDALADGVQWTIIGSTELSGVYRGKREVTGNLLARLRARLVTPGPLRLGLPGGVRGVGKPRRLVHHG